MCFFRFRWNFASQADGKQDLAVWFVVLSARLAPCPAFVGVFFILFQLLPSKASRVEPTLSYCRHQPLLEEAERPLSPCATDWKK